MAGSYQERTGHHDDDATVGRRLGIEGGDIVSNLLEGQALRIRQVISD